MKKALSILLICCFVFMGSSCGAKPVHITDTTVVYWVPKGKVYHIDKHCSTLRRSKDIESGYVWQAKNAGKSRLCEVCGQGDIDDTK